MNITDELHKLSALHRNGDLTDAEFAQAKERVLATPSIQEPLEKSDTVGHAANRFVSFQIAMAVVGFAIALFLFGAIFLPHLQSMNKSMQHMSGDDVQLGLPVGR